jgi:hypothetical protein
MPKPTPPTTDDGRMVLLAVLPAWLARKVEREFGDEIRKAGDMFMTDLMQETDAELSDEHAKIEIKVRRKGGR